MQLKNLLFYLNVSLALLFYSLNYPAFAQTAMDFDGVDDYISAENASTLIADSPMSLSMWVYPRNEAPVYPNFDGFAGFRDNSSADFYILQLGPKDVEARFRNSSGTTFDIIHDGLEIDKWNHFVLSYDGETLVLFHNGEQVGSIAANGYITSETQTFYMGMLPFSVEQFQLDGQLEDVLLWNKALTEEDAKSMYNNSCSLDIADDAIQLAYLFEEGLPGENNSGIVETIDYKNDYNGTLNNFSLNENASNYVIFFKNNNTAIDVEECTSFTAPSGLYEWTESGTYVDTIQSVSGCDSIITINLTIGLTSEITADACHSYMLPTGEMATSSGTYTVVLMSSEGCDSTINITLTITDNSTGTTSANDCDKYTGPSGNYTWTESGIYTDTIPNSAGCDSIITIDLNIVGLNITITQDGNTLTSNQDGAIYHWLDCNNGMTAISGASSQSYMPGKSGSYAVEILKDGCIKTTECFDFVFTTIEGNQWNDTDLLLNKRIGEGLYEVTWTKKLMASDNINVSVYNIAGRSINASIVHSSDKILIQIPIDSPAGMYFMKIAGHDWKRIFKLLK